MALFSSKNQVGLYIDTETISVVNAQPTSAKVEIGGFAELKTSTSLTAGTAESKQKTLTDIRSALNSANVQSRTVLISIPGEGSMTRHFELPMLPKKEERNAVRFEAQKYVPFDMKDLYYDYETYPDAARKRNRIVLFACKKQWVDALSALLTLAGLKIDQIELVSHSIARAFHRHAAKSNEEIALVIVASEGKTAELVIQRGGSVLTTRHVSLAKNADSSTLDIPMFVSDVRISMDYFSENFKDLKLQRIFVSTPFQDLQNVCDALRKELSLPTDSGNLFQPPSASTAATAAVAAYGLTLRTLEKKPGRRVSLKPTEATSVAPILTWEQEKKQLQDFAVKEIILIAALLAGVFIWINQLSGGKRQQLMSAAESYPKSNYASMTEPLSDLQLKQNDITQKKTFFISLVDKRVFFTMKMNELAKIVPTNVRLSKLNYEDTLSMQGTSDLRIIIDGSVLPDETTGPLSTINKIVAQMKASETFMKGLSDIRIVTTKKDTQGARQTTRFTLECSTKT